MQQFKIGDIVQLRSGGPNMTVEDIEPIPGKNLIDCQWFAGGKLNHGRFPPESLTKVEEEEKGEKSNR
jgi:uncharacterized protein YodC (DUF2158 family)